jgi:hypothetical protein
MVTWAVSCRDKKRRHDFGKRKKFWLRNFETELSSKDALFLTQLLDQQQFPQYIQHIFFSVAIGARSAV